MWHHNTQFYQVKLICDWQLFSFCTDRLTDDEKQYLLCEHDCNTGNKIMKISGTFIILLETA